MKTILVIGAGRSSATMIKYLLDNAVDQNWMIHVVDADIDAAKEKVNGHQRGLCFEFDATNKEERIEKIKEADLVISMLPAYLHLEVVKDCIDYKKHIITPSYISDEVRALDDDAKKAGVMVLNEMGLDPGIDHMSAMKVIDDIKDRGGVIKSFKSYCGGLVPPEYDTNPWNYKFTWNPRNVVLAGQGTAQYIDSGKYKYIPYGQLFKRTDTINVLNYGQFEAYANRDSLSYREVYKLNDIPTLFRGTLRKPGYSEAWDLFVQMGMTDDSYEMDVSGMNYSTFLIHLLI